jgi:predicted GH43/DUF377 family glycosyl hydrolase
MKGNWPVVWACVLLLLPGLATAQTEWVDDPVDPVLESGGTGEWDERNFYPGIVIKVDGTYHMYYIGHLVGAPFLEELDIGHATSTDGIVWERDPANPVLTRGAGGEWDDHSLLRMAVIHDASGFRMWYEGLGQTSDSSWVGYATSPDGSVWTKHPDNPIMAPGSPGTFDAGGVGPQAVIVRDGLYQMWYAAMPNSATGISDVSVGYAESDDGLSWIRRSEPVLEPTSGWESGRLGHPSVRFDGARYQMWYTGASSVPSIGYAVSSDGIEWTRYFLNPVIPPRVEVAEVLFNDQTGDFEMWYRPQAEGAIRRAVSDCCTTIFGSVIPAAAYAAGAEGSFYETTLELNNAGSTDADYVMSWLPRGETNTEPVESERFTLAAGMDVRYQNVLADVFGLEPDAFGALVIESSSPDLLAMARIANTPPEKAAGTFGQFIPAVKFDDFTGMRERRRLLFGTEHADMRFNVGCVNADSTPGGIDLELYSADGTVLGTESLILMPWSNDQINRIFEPYQPVTGYVEFWSRAAQGKIYCYGSVLDNVTSDPMTVPPM